jgi:hypothetical protein
MVSNPTNENSSENTSENVEKEKNTELKDLAQDYDDVITMNHLAISGYKSLTRITNFGWQNAQTKSHSLLSSSHQEHSKKKEHTHISSQKRWLPNHPLLLHTEPTRQKTEVPLH